MAGREGVNGIVKSHIVALIFKRIEMFVKVSSFIMSPEQLSWINSWNVGDKIILLKDDVADFILST